MSTDLPITASIDSSVKLYLDGNQWCALHGENLQEGVSGWGDSPLEAIAHLMHADIGDTSDGHHTFSELYRHRCLLFALAIRGLKRLKAWRSQFHEDGSCFSGWFLVGLELPTGTITYHLPDPMWSLLDSVQTLDRAPAWDGHTSQDVLDRIADFLQSPPF